MWVPILAALVVGAVVAGAYVSSLPPPPLTEMCVQHGGIGVHNHVTLRFVILGADHPIPDDIGIVSSDCYRPLHTHRGEPGIVHIELPSPRNVYLRDFFAIWGETFSRTQILTYAADATHEVSFFVDAAPNDSYEDLMLLNGQLVVIEYRSV